MALAHDPSDIVSTVLIAAGDMLFLPDEDRVNIGRRLVFAADDGVDGVVLWTSDGTEAGTRRIGPIGPTGEHTDGRADTGEVPLSAQESPIPNSQPDGHVNGQEETLVDP